jgi:PKD domain/Secretion system C-terminal sorting domain
MKHFYALALLLFAAHPDLFAQTGCPGCLIDLPANLPADTVYLPPLPDGQQNEPFDEDISFRMPKTTTPVAVIDSTTPPGLTISSIKILAVEGLPAGLSWQASQTVFQVATETDGCIKVCGTPLQSGFFELTIRLEATVFFITQETEFTNNLPSNGQPGWTYSWDFGDGTTFEGENPLPHVYDTAGTYIVHYQAIIDTIGYVLVNVLLDELECVDQLGLGTPDVYVQVLDSTGTIIFDSSPAVNNINLPATFPINLILGQGNYTLKVIDDDGGLKGGDDICGLLTFNYLSNGPVTAGGFVGALGIVHPVKTILSTDTVIVYSAPAPPIVVAEKGTVTCSNQTPLPLVASYNTGIQWWLDSMPVFGATSTPLLAEESGTYTLQYTSPEGCTAVSAPVSLSVLPIPALPLFTNVKNVLWVVDSLSIPMSGYSLQWYADSVALDGETGYYLCTLDAGYYQLVITDLATGCQNDYAQNTLFNPNFDCTVGAYSLIESTDRWHIMPNPFNEELILTWDGPTNAPTYVRIFDAAGKLVISQPASTDTSIWRWNTAHWASGIYMVQVFTTSGSFGWKVMHP